MTRPSKLRNVALRRSTQDRTEGLSARSSGTDDEGFDPGSRLAQESPVANSPRTIMPFIANGLAVAYSGEPRRGGLTLRIACETAVGAAEIVCQAIMA
jgi:hypothetical protein